MIFSFDRVARLNLPLCHGRVKMNIFTKLYLKVFISFKIQVYSGLIQGQLQPHEQHKTYSILFSLVGTKIQRSSIKLAKYHASNSVHVLRFQIQFEV